MNMSLLIFCIVLFACVVLSLFAGSFFLCLPRLSEGRVAEAGGFARNRLAGIIFGAAALAWLVPNIEPILSPDSLLRFLLWPLVPIVLVICAVWLDFLFARAFAGILILLSHYLLKEVYPLDVPYAWIFSIPVFIVGVFGIFLAAKPHWFREILIRSRTHAIMRLSFCVSVFYFGAGCVFVLFFAVKELVK